MLMTAILTILVCVLLFAILYLIFNYKIVKITEKRFKEYYKAHIQSDAQEIYREMESYAAIFENRIHRFKQLLERQEDNLKEWNKILENVKTTKKAKEMLEMVQKNFQQNSNKQENEREVIKKQENRKNETDKKKYTGSSISPFKATKSKNKGEISKEKENLTNHSPAEELMKQILTHENQSNVNKDSNSSSAPLTTVNPPHLENTKASFEGRQSKEIDIIQFLAKLGRYITNKQPTHQEDSFNKGSEKPQLNFENLIKNNLSKDMVKINQSAPQERQEEANQTRSETPKPQTTLSEKDIISFLEDLDNNKKRPDALRALLSNGFNLSDISEMSNIPYSDLRMTRNIYEI